jgi:lipoprotein signal peptidase
MFTKIVGISFYSTIFYFTKNNTIRFFTIFIISSGIGNLISHFYYPYRVIDFIDIEGSYELFKIGVSNLADFAFDIGFCGLLITLVVLTAKKIINHFKLHKNK